MTCIEVVCKEKDNVKINNKTINNNLLISDLSHYNNKKTEPIILKNKLYEIKQFGYECVMNTLTLHFANFLKIKGYDELSEKDKKALLDGNDFSGVEFDAKTSLGMKLVAGGTILYKSFIGSDRCTVIIGKLLLVASGNSRFLKYACAKDKMY